jgi:hypothetical protein
MKESPRSKLFQMVQAKKRYSSFSVLWCGPGCQLLFLATRVIVMVMLDSDESKGVLNEWTSLAGLIKKMLTIACQSVFYFYTLNYYNKANGEKDECMVLSQLLPR